MKISTVNSRSILDSDRLDAHFFTSPGVAASERIAQIREGGTDVVALGSIARVWDPPRFARVRAEPSEEAVEYLRPYDAFDFIPTAMSSLSALRNKDIDRLVPSVGTILQTCSGRNLGPCAYVDRHLSVFAMSHDMIRIEVDDRDHRAYVYAFLKTSIGQALLRRNRSGSVIDHLTTEDVASVAIPLIEPERQAQIVDAVTRSLTLLEEGRGNLIRLLRDQQARLPFPKRERGYRSWTTYSDSIFDRLDVAYYDPVVLAARELSKSHGGIPLRDIADARLPVRYKRYYVGENSGRPILSGRQLLQFEPVNLRWVSGRSFAQIEDYEVLEGMTIFGAVGRSEGRQGFASLVTRDRANWLASNDVMRLTPRNGIRPGALWLAFSSMHARAQVNALSFGSVIDHLNPQDVEGVVLPVIDDKDALDAEASWRAIAESAELLRDAVNMLEKFLGEL